MLLVNSDIYSIISGHRNYFMDMKRNHESEMARLAILYEDANCKNFELEKEMKIMKKEYDIEKERLEKEIHFFKERVIKLFLNVLNFFNNFSLLKKRRKNLCRQIWIIFN